MLSVVFFRFWYLFTMVLFSCVERVGPAAAPPKDRVTSKGIVAEAGSNSHPCSPRCSNSEFPFLSFPARTPSPLGPARLLCKQTLSASERSRELESPILLSARQRISCFIERVARQRSRASRLGRRVLEAYRAGAVPTNSALPAAGRRAPTSAVLASGFAKMRR